MRKKDVYKRQAQQGKFSGSNSLFSLDLAASQFGAEKVVATADNKITMYASETVTIGSDATVVLKHCLLYTS